MKEDSPIPFSKPEAIQGSPEGTFANGGPEIDRSGPSGGIGRNWQTVTGRPSPDHGDFHPDFAGPA